MSDDDPERTCGNCGTAVGRYSTFCPSCGVVLSEYEDDASGEAVAGEDTVGADPRPGDTYAATYGDSDVGSDATFDDPAGAATGMADGSTDPTAVGETAERDGDDGGLLHPEGLLDNTLTIVVAGIAGVVVGILTTFTFAVATDMVWTAWLGVAAWLGTTGVVARQYRVRDAVAYGCYAVAISILLVPVIALGPNAEGGDPGGQIILFLIGEVFAVVVAGVVAVVGYLFKYKRDHDGSEA